MKRRANLSRWLLAAVLLAFGLGGCRGSLEIGQLLDDPGYYDGRKVRVVGEVTDAAGLLGRGVYRLSDGTGELVVLSEEGGVPRAGARVRVDGWFQQVLTVGDRTMAGLVESGRGRP